MTVRRKDKKIEMLFYFVVIGYLKERRERKKAEIGLKALFLLEDIKTELKTINKYLYMIENRDKIVYEGKKAYDEFIDILSGKKVYPDTPEGRYQQEKEKEQAIDMMWRKDMLERGVPEKIVADGLKKINNYLHDLYKVEDKMKKYKMEDDLSYLEAQMNQLSVDIAEVYTRAKNLGIITEKLYKKRLGLKTIILLLTGIGSMGLAYTFLTTPNIAGYFILPTFESLVLSLIFLVIIVFAYIFLFRKK